MFQEINPLMTPIIFDSLSQHLPVRSGTLSNPTIPAPPGNLQQPASIRGICRDFLQALKYCPRDEIEESNILYQTLLSEFSSYDTGGKWFGALCRESATVAEFCYSHNSFEARLRVARYTWYLVYIDDLGRKLPASLESFQESVVANSAPQGAFLQDFREHLADIYGLWDPIPANCIITSALDFVSGCFMEQMPAIRDMKISPNARSWPYYLRNKTGSAAGYAFLLFPKELQLDMNVYIQVIEDIMLFINLANDILSFYKEELVGETNNYVHNRAHVSGKSIPDTLQDVVNDTLDAHQRICDVLKESSAYIPWVQFVNGYLAFHYNMKRYRLQDLNLLES